MHAKPKYNGLYSMFLNSSDVFHLDKLRYSLKSKLSPTPPISIVNDISLWVSLMPPASYCVYLTNHKALFGGALYVTRLLYLILNLYNLDLVQTLEFIDDDLNSLF